MIQQLRPIRTLHCTVPPCSRTEALNESELTVIPWLGAENVDVIAV